MAFWEDLVKKKKIPGHQPELVRLANQVCSYLNKVFDCSGFANQGLIRLSALRILRHVD